MGEEMLTLEEVLAAHDLAGRDLSGFSLGYTDLRGKCLREANLSYAQLGKSLLAGADLRNANLSQANLGAADLTGADLRYADLREANLNGAILVGADVRHALGLDQPFVISAGAPFQPQSPTESEEYKAAIAEGYHPLTHWCREYSVVGKRMPTYEDIPVWRKLRDHFGELIFKDQEIFNHVRLIQQYIDFPRWAYLLTAQGFETIMGTLGMQVSALETTN